jgi:hypothetical protein
MTQHERTRYGGVRRTGVAHGEQLADSQSVGGSTPRPRATYPIITWAEKLGLPECPYVIRWSIRFRSWGVRLHHWLGPDDDRAFHDHPWWFLTLVLRGGYTDRSPAGDDHLRTGSIRFRPALHQHTVVPDNDRTWTLIITGPWVRFWGFWPEGKFVKANKYFLTRGHHPCD